MYRAISRGWRRPRQHENGDADPVSAGTSSASATNGSAGSSPLNNGGTAGFRGFPRSRTKFACSLLLVQATCLLLFAAFAEYDDVTLGPRHPSSHLQHSGHRTDTDEEDAAASFPRVDLEISVDVSSNVSHHHVHQVASESELADEGFYPFTGPSTSPTSSPSSPLTDFADDEDEGSGDVEPDEELHKPVVHTSLSDNTTRTVLVSEEVKPNSSSSSIPHQQQSKGAEEEEEMVLFASPRHQEGPRSFLHDYQSRDPQLASVYPMFQDVHVMMFIGFGFLMTFLKKYGYSAVGVNMLLAAVVLQWATLCQGFFHNHDGKILLDITSLLNADFAAATVLISFGALLGKTSPLQLLVMSVIEIVIFATNEWIGLHIFGTSDVGASVLVHVFGAYFGLTVSLVLYSRDVHDSTKEGAVYHSDIFAMIGTIFLWLFWPSFNGALAPAHAQHRVIINTYYSLAACCVTTFAISSLVDKRNRFNMVHVQNSTLAGGVAIGTAADLMVEPYGAMLVGISAAILSVLGYHYVTPFLAKRLRIHDTCGVHNLHGMPGVLAGIVGIILAATASETEYGKGLYEQYPMRAPVDNSSDLIDIQAVLASVKPGEGWSASKQAGFQAVTLVTTLAVAIVGGLVTGVILRVPFFDPPSATQLFDDEDFWEVPEEEPLMMTSSAPSSKQEDSKTSNDSNCLKEDMLSMTVY